MSEPPELRGAHLPHRGAGLSEQPPQRYHPYPSPPGSLSHRGHAQHPSHSYLAGPPPTRSESTSGPSLGWLGTNNSATFSGDPPAPNTSNMPPMVIDSIATEQRLSGDQRVELHRFAKGNANVQRTQLYAHQLALDNKLADIESLVTDVQKATGQISNTVTSDWKPNESQKKTIRQLCWHYLTYDMDSYLLLYSHVQDVIRESPAGTLGLPDYGSNEARVLTDEVNTYIRHEANNTKSRFKKSMDTAAVSHSCLEDFTRSILKAHRMNFATSSTIDDTHKAVFAKYRDVAFRLLEKQRHSPNAETQTGSSSQRPADKSKGRTLRSDSGYWKLLDDETGHRLNKFGADRSSREWVQWRKELIENDERRYGIQPAVSNALQAALVGGTGGYLPTAPAE